MEGAAWAGARRLAGSMPEGLASVWAQEAELTLFRRLQFDVERERVLAAMGCAGLAHLPLKGILMAGYYPDPTMRSMADNDILYGFVEDAPGGGFRARPGSEGEATKVLSEVMDCLGYEDQVLGRENADCFYKEPCFNFEMHRVLVQSRYELAGHFDNPWERATPDAPGSLAFHWDASDEYIFHVAHAYKHYAESGCGVRHALDEHVFLAVRGAEVDWGYVGRRMREMGIDGFERCLRRAAEEAFGIQASGGAGPTLSPESGELLGRMLSAGTYGNMATRVENLVGGFVSEGVSPVSAKLRYLARRVVPDDAALAEYHPLVARHKALVPFLALSRLAKALPKLPVVLREVGEVRRFRV